MRFFKTFLSLAMTLIMFFSTALSLRAESFTDTVGTKYEKATEVLAGLGIIEGREEGNYKPEETLTRAEMVVTILRIMQMEELEDESLIFDDVDYEHWAFYPITTAYKLGIINGVDSKHFMPDGLVTGAQAIKMVVNLLGYSVRAEATGGFPAGYIMCANQLDILKGVSAVGDAEISRGDMAILLYNAINTPMLLPEGYGADSGSYTEDNSKTPLSNYMNVSKIEGLITATYTQEIVAPARKLNDTEIVVGDKILEIGSTNADTLFGEKIVAYCKTSEDNLNILAVTSKSTVETIPGYSVLPETTNAVLCYEDNGETKKITIAGASVVVNGEPVATPSALDLQPQTGSIKLVLMGNTVEFVVVENYENYVIERVQKSARTVDVFENRLGIKKLSFDNDIPVIFTLPDGTKADVADCKAWDILSVADSASGKYRRAVLSSNSITGTLNEISTDAVIVGETEYKLADSLLQQPGFEFPRLGTEVSFSLNMDNFVAGINTDVQAGVYYAWLLNAAFTKGMDARPQLRLFTQEGKAEVLDCTQKIVFNKTSVDAAEILSASSPLLENNAIKPQLVKYQKNGEKIALLETAADYRYDFENNTRIDEFSLDAYIKKGYQLDNGKESDEWTLFMGGRLNSFGRNWLVRSETVIFVIPGSGEEKDYYIKSWDAMKHGTEYTEIYDDVGLYDITEDHVISAMVWDRRDEDGSAPQYPVNEASMGLVESVSFLADENGETVCKLAVCPETGGSTSIMAGAELKVLFGEASTNRETDPVVLRNGGVRPAIISASDINAGDIIQYETDANRNAVNISVLFRGQHPANYEKNSSNGVINETNSFRNYGGKLMSYGTILRETKYGFAAEVTLYDKSKDGPSNVTLESMILDARYLYCFDSRVGKVKTISKEEVESGDKALYITRLTVPLMTIIYR